MIFKGPLRAVLSRFEVLRSCWSWVRKYLPPGLWGRLSASTCLAGFSGSGREGPEIFVLGNIHLVLQPTHIPWESVWAMLLPRKPESPPCTEESQPFFPQGKAVLPHVLSPLRETLGYTCSSALKTLSRPFLHFLCGPPVWWTQFLIRKWELQF